MSSFTVDLRNPLWGRWLLLLPFTFMVLPKAIVLFALLMAVGAVLVPGLRRLQRIMPRQSLHTAAIIVALVYTILLVVLGIFAIPAVVKGVAGWNEEAQAALKVLPAVYKDLLQYIYGTLDSLGVTPEMIDAAVKEFKSHISVLAEPAKVAATWTAGFFIHVPIGIVEGILFGYVALMVAWILADEHHLVRGFFDQFFPNQVDDIADMATVFQDSGSRLFSGMAKVMLACSVIFTLLLKFAFHMTWGQSLFYGTALGVTGGIPFIGGFINYGIITVVGLNHFGPSWMFVFLYASVFVVHHIETGALSPYFIGSSLDMKYLAFMSCLLIGAVVLGAGLLGVAFGLLLLVYYKAVCSVVGVQRPAIVQVPASPATTLVAA